MGTISQLKWPELMRSISDGSVGCCEFLRRSRLRLDIISGEAGLELSTCNAGYAISKILARPGQPELTEGDAIVAIGGKILSGLEAEQVEERFGEAFCDGAEIVIGSVAQLAQWPFEVVLHAAQRFLAESVPFVPKLERTSTN